MEIMKHKRSFKRKMRDTVNAILNPLDIHVTRRSEIDLYRKDTDPLLNYSDFPLDDTSRKYLKHNNPRYQELVTKYKDLDFQNEHTVWSKGVSEVDLMYFRGDAPYVWQYRDRNTEIHYLLSAYYLKSIDSLNLFDKLEEDNQFGCFTYEFDGNKKVSRDLMDSMLEIYFLDKAINLSSRGDIKVLDIGAGYGRFAYRLITAMDNVKQVFLVDAVPDSTFISEYYMKFRGVDDRAIVVALDDVAELLETEKVDLAVNIHSFSECSRSSICWWLDLLVKNEVRYFMIVPHAGKCGGRKIESAERDRPHIDIIPELNKRGYQLIQDQDKYLDPQVQKYGVSPTHFYLFELK